VYGYTPRIAKVDSWNGSPKQNYCQKKKIFTTPALKEPHAPNFHSWNHNSINPVPGSKFQVLELKQLRRTEIAISIWLQRSKVAKNKMREYIRIYYSKMIENGNSADKTRR